MSADRASVSSTEHLDSTPGRQSGIVAAGTGEVVREAMLVTDRRMQDAGRQQDIDVDVMASGLTSRSDDIEPAPISVPEESVIEVSDVELEPADAALLGRQSVAPGRATLPPGSGPRSRPPVPPSARPKMDSGRVAVSAVRRVDAGAIVESDGRPSAPPSSRNDPWALANRTLELNRARARIAELEEFIAFRDARIVTLEDRLEKAQARIDELEQRLDPIAFAEARREASSSLAPGVAGLFDPRRKRPAQHGLGAAQSVGDAVRRDRVEATAVASSHVVNRGDEERSATATATDRGAARPSGADVDLFSSDAEHSDADLSETELSDTELSDTELSDTDPPDTESDAPRATGTEEDLRVIAGIGARFEAALRKQGITRLSQIASWSDADVRQVAKALKIPKSRIVKGRWIESAREAIGCRAASE